MSSFSILDAQTGIKIVQTFNVKHSGEGSFGQCQKFESIFKLRLGASIIPNLGRAVGLSGCRSVWRSVENFKITGFRGLTCLNLKTNLARYTN